MNRNINIALESIFANKIRALLTMLGIIFGVAAVIAMLAIGNGAQQKILKQLQVVGANNIFVQSEWEPETEEGQEKRVFSPGLRIEDLENIREIIPNIRLITPEIGYDCYANSRTKRQKSKIVGVSPDYFKIFNLKTGTGVFFNETHGALHKKVCVLGGSVSKKLFPNSSPIGQIVRVGKLNLVVVGVLKAHGSIGENLQDMGINDYNDDIYVPVETVLLSYKNRARTRLAQQGYWFEEEDNKKENYNQLDKIVVQMGGREHMTSGVLLLSKILKRRHNNAPDFSMIVPEQLLQQQKETDDLFNLLLGAIAGISLLVGGIGIMNIMLASVLERIKEIGLRQAVGARKKDIKNQFIFEALLISLSGGFIGVFLGISMCFLIENLLDMPVKISNFSIILSFGISVFIGIVFGYMPANKAAEQNPVNSLHHD